MTGVVALAAGALAAGLFLLAVGCLWLGIANGSVTMEHLAKGAIVVGVVLVFWGLAARGCC